jgi:Arc/MetJ-type ribon-helix-helix transcriptional regulator
METLAPEPEDLRLKALRQALIEGENSGPSRPLDPDAFLVEMHRRFEPEA